VVVAVGVKPAPAWVLGSEPRFEALERLAQVVAGLPLFVVVCSPGLEFAPCLLGLWAISF
jgi:hypothetical protein